MNTFTPFSRNTLINASMSRSGSSSAVCDSISSSARTGFSMVVVTASLLGCLSPPAWRSLPEYLRPKRGVNAPHHLLPAQAHRPLGRPRERPGPSQPASLHPGTGARAGPGHGHLRPWRKRAASRTWTSSQLCSRPAYKAARWRCSDDWARRRLVSRERARLLLSARMARRRHALALRRSIRRRLGVLSRRARRARRRHLLRRRLARRRSRAARYSSPAAALSLLNREAGFPGLGVLPGQGLRGRMGNERKL